MRLLGKMLLQFCLTVGSIILISGLPDLFLHKSVQAYFEKVKMVVIQLMHMPDMAYHLENKDYSFFPSVWDPYFYSLTILIVSILIAFVLAQALTWLAVMMHPRIRVAIKGILTFLESMPDLLIFALAQMSIVVVFQKTGVLLSDVASINGQKIYLLPIMCLAILPLVYFFKMMFLLTEEELKKHYIELGRAKGMTLGYLIVFHVTRNTLESILHFSKTILWFMISNLFLVEIIFNITGITHYMYVDFRPEMLAACLILLAAPFFLLFTLLEWIVNKTVQKEVQV